MQLSGPVSVRAVVKVHAYSFDMYNGPSGVSQEVCCQHRGSSTNLELWSVPRSHYLLNAELMKKHKKLIEAKISSSLLKLHSSTLPFFGAAGRDTYGVT